MKYFSLYVLILAGLTLSAQAQLPNWLQQAKNTLSGIKGNLMNRLFNNPEFASVNETVRNAFRSGDLSSLDSITIGQIPAKIWQSVGIGPILTLGKEKVQSLITFGRITSKSMQTELQNYIAANISQAEAITQLAVQFRSQSGSSGSPNDGSRGLIQLLLSRLGAPESWTVENIKNMSQVLFYLPIDMMQRMQNTEAVRELNRQVTLCINNGNGSSDPKSFSCPTVDESKGQQDNPRSKYIAGVKALVTLKVHGDPKGWSNDTFAMMNVQALPPTLLKKVPGNVLALKKQEIVTMLNANDDTGMMKRDMIGRDVVEKFMTSQNVMGMDANQVITFAQSLGGYLGAMVYSSDVSANVLAANPQLKTTLTNNDANAFRTGNMDAQLVKNKVQEWAAMRNVTPTQARQAGMTAFSLASANTLNATLRLLNPSKQDIKDLTVGIAATGGPGAAGKLRAIAPAIFLAAGGSGALDLALIPMQMYDMIPLNNLANMDKNSAKTILNGMTSDVQPGQISTLIAKLGFSELTSLDANAKAFLSMNQANQAISSLGATSAPSLAVDMPASSPLGMMVASEVLGKLNPLILRGRQSLVPFMGVAEAMNVEQNNIASAFVDMGDVQPTRGACFVLKDKFVNNSMATLNTDGEAEAFSLLMTTDIEVMPPCVVAAFGKARVMSMSNDMKIALYMRVLALGDALLTSDGLAQDMTELIIAQAFAAMNKPAQLTGVDVDSLQGALLLTPTNYLASISDDAAPAALAIFNEMAASPIMPCLDGGKLGAIRNLIFKSLGPNPSQWTDVSTVCCLLYTLSGSDINNIPPGALVTCSCYMVDEDRFKSEAMNKEIMCGGSLSAEMSAKASVEDAQMRAMLTMIDPYNLPTQQNGRRKRGIRDLSICDRAVSGVDAIGQDEINNMSMDDLNMCLSGLGSRYMDSVKAAALAYKVTQSVNPPIYSSLSLQNLTDMGFILRGIIETDIPNLPSLTSPQFNNVVMRLGQPDLMLSTEQLKAYAAKVVSTWKQGISSWTAQDIATVNRLICGMTSTIINQFTTSSFRDAVPFVQEAVTGCDMQNVIMPLAAKAAAGYGDSGGWNKALVREMGQLFAGLDPNIVASLNAKAAAGITPGAVSIMPMSVTAKMNAGQINNMEASSARLFSPEQVSNFSPEMRAALERSLSRAEGGASSVIVSAVLMAVASVLALLL